MADLFEQVLRHLEGNSETETQNWELVDGITTVEVAKYGPVIWIESVYELERMMAMDCLALILFVLDKFFSTEKQRRIVEGWAVELRKAVSAGEVKARDPITLLPLEALPDGWDWLLSMADADRFIASHGMDCRFGEVVSHLFKLYEADIQKRRFPQFIWAQSAPTQDTETPAPVMQLAEIKEQRQDRRLKMCVDAGLKMDKRALSRLPDGVGSIAVLEGVKRQTFTDDVKAALKRREAAIREGKTIRRA